MSAVRLHDQDAEARSVAALTRRGATPARAREVVASRPARGLVDVGASAKKLREQFALAEESLREAGVFERTEAEEEAQRLAEAEAGRAELIENLARRGIALKHGRVLAGVLPLHETYALDLARRWGRSDRTLLVLCGPKGCGKSLAASEQAHLAGGRSVPARVLLRHAWYQNRTDKDGRPLRSPVTHTHQAELLSTPLLVIDDAGQEADDDRAKTVEVIDTLICLRCDAGLPTVITTNFRKATAEDYGKRREAFAKGDLRAATEALAGTWDGYLGGRAETTGARVVEYGAVIQCPDQDIRAQEAAERRAQR